MGDVGSQKMMIPDKLVILTGTLDCHFAENYQIALRNFRDGKPLFAGMLPATHVPDPNGLPEVLELTFGSQESPCMP